MMIKMIVFLDILLIRMAITSENISFMLDTFDYFLHI